MCACVRYYPAVCCNCIVVGKRSPILSYILKLLGYFGTAHHCSCFCQSIGLLNNSQTSRPRELSDLVTRRPEAVAPECSEGNTNGLRVTKSLSSRRSWRLTYLDYTEQESHDNTFKHHYKRGRASYRFPE